VDFFPFSDLSIHRKLIRISQISSAVALLLSCSVFVSYDWFTSRHSLAQSLLVNGDIVGYNSTSALIFNDASSATETLKAFQSRINIISAAILNAKGQLFASYQRSDQTHPIVLPSDFPYHDKKYQFSNGFLFIYDPILSEGTVIGYVYIQSDLQTIHSRLERYLVIALGILLISFMGAALITAPLAQRISRLEEALQESEERLRLMIESVTDYAVYMLSPTGHIASWNKGAERLKGYNVDEVLGHHFSKFYSSEDQVNKKPEKELEIASTQGRVEEEGWRIRKDGSRFWANTIITPIRDKNGRLRGFSKVTRDMTERKQAEENSRLLTENLLKQTEQLKIANKELESFSYSVSHDLRAPLRAIDGFSKRIIEEYASKMDDEGRRLLNVITRNTRQMNELIEGLLSFSRLARQEPNLKPLDMSRIVRSIIDDLLASEPGRILDLTLKPLAFGNGDPLLIKQVWVNLLSNAFKFTRHTAKPSIEVGSFAKEGEIVYYVKDNGAGFDMAYADKLFGIFQRLHSTNEFEGTGIGLANIHRIIARHHGRVWAEGKINGGATFYFSLPKGENE